MAAQNDWVTATEAARLAGCSRAFICKELMEHYDADQNRTVGGRLDGWKMGRSWAVSRLTAMGMRSTLTTRAKIHEADRLQKKAAKKRPKRKSR